VKFIGNKNNLKLKLIKNVCCRGTLVQTPGHLL